MRIGERMTEAEELTLQRFAALARGYDRGVPRLTWMYLYLLENVHNRHIRAMTRHMEGRGTADQEACRVVAKALGEIDPSAPVPDLNIEQLPYCDIPEIPRFLRKPRAPAGQ